MGNEKSTLNKPLNAPSEKNGTSSERDTKSTVHILRDALTDQPKKSVHFSSSATSDNHDSAEEKKKDLARFTPVKYNKAPSKKKLIDDNIERFENIYSEPLEIDDTFKAPVHEKNDEQKQFIRETLLHCFVFSHLDESELLILIDAMEHHTVRKDTVIISQGEDADYFYIIESGTVTFSVDGKDVGEGTHGRSFGELALSYNCPRTATCLATEDCSLWRVDRATFKQIIANSRKKKEMKTVGNLKQVDLFKNFSEEMLIKINDTLVEKRYNAGELIIEKGEEGSTFYIIDKGTVAVTNIGLSSSSQHVDRDLFPGDFFGERALMTGDVRSATIIAKEDDTVLLCMDRYDFNKTLGPLDELIRNIQFKQTLLSIPLIAKSRISDEDKAKLVPLLNEVKFNKDDVIYDRGQWIRPTLYFLTSGSVEKISKDGESTVLQREDYFGDETYEQARGGVVESQYCIKVLEDNTTCEVLTLNAIQVVMRTCSKLITGKNFDGSIHLESCLTFERLKKHKMLGAGSFGQVWLISDIKSGSTYALKLMSKPRIIKTRQWKSVIREKEIMSMVDHPFILKMVNAFQDDTFVCMVMELYLGGELFTILHAPGNRHGLKEDRAAFYVACVVEAFGYLHQRQIVYRDLKPENLLLDAHGYLVVIDFGFAKVVKNKTFTVCGTPLYIAPEILLERGHDRAADIWSLGTFIYELCVGKTPFYSDGISQSALFKKICIGQYAFPKHISADAEDLIYRILVPRPTSRLGCLANGDDDIRQHPWFKDIDFALLPRKKVDPPFVPTVKDPMDTSNFEDWSEMENQYDNEKPPSPSHQKYFEDF